MIKQVTRLQAALLLLVAGCDSQSPSLPTRFNADNARLSACELAMQAAAAARASYDQDYEARTGNSSVRVTINDFDSCFWADDGVFLGTLGGKRIRFVPRDSASPFMFTTDPKKVMKSDGGEIWFSEWRGDMAPDAQSKALLEKFRNAPVVFVDQ